MFFVLAISSQLLMAHHGKKYLVTSSYELPQPGSVHALWVNEFGRASDDHAFGFVPGILYGITHYWDAELHLHQSFEESVFKTDAIALESRFGLWGDYSEQGEREADEDGLSSFGGAILLEIERSLRDPTESFEARFIVGGETRTLSYAMNFVWQRSLRASTLSQTRYAIGLKKSLAHGVGVGLEIDGTLAGFEELRWTPGLYLAATDRVDLKIGASLPTNPTSDDYTIRMAFVWAL